MTKEELEKKYNRLVMTESEVKAARVNANSTSVLLDEVLVIDDNWDGVDPFEDLDD